MNLFHKFSPLFMASLFIQCQVAHGNELGDKPTKQSFRISEWLDIRSERFAGGAHCDSDGIAGTGRDDRAAVQAAFDSIDPNSGATVYIPRGRICRLSGFVHAHSGNLEITGGGSLFFDTPQVSDRPSFSKLHSHMYAAGLIISTPGCILKSATLPDDPMSGFSTSAIISNIKLHNFSVLSVGSYEGLEWNNRPEPESNIALDHNGIHVWCARNVSIDNVTISGFGSDALELWGVEGLSITNNTIKNVGFNGIGTWMVTSVHLHENRFYAVGQGAELNGRNFAITNNQIEKVAMSGILLAGGGSSNLNIDVLATGNSIVRDPVIGDGGYGINVTCSGSDMECIGSIFLTNNYVAGQWSVGIASHPGKSVVIAENVLFLSAKLGNSGIQSESRKAWGGMPIVQIRRNWITLTSTGYQTAIAAALFSPVGVHSAVTENTISSPGFSASHPDGIYLYSIPKSLRFGNSFNGRIDFAAPGFQ